MWVKICGIRDVETARQVASLEPDAIGLNFYPRSPRCVPRDVAVDIVRELTGGLQLAGVFVNAAVTEIVDVHGDCKLNMIQVHGDESPEFLAELQSLLPNVELIRAWRMDDDLADLANYLAECRRLWVGLFGCLIDAKVTGSYGGTGQTPPWNVLHRDYQRTAWPPMILAGGLTPDTVAAGISTVQPFGVDVASGVETSPGVKDLARVAEFLAQARSRDQDFMD